MSNEEGEILTEILFVLRGNVGNDETSRGFIDDSVAHADNKLGSQSCGGGGNSVLGDLSSTMGNLEFWLIRINYE